MKICVVILALLSLLLVTACANPGAGDPLRVKCPACGYEFDVERSE